MQAVTDNDTDAAANATERYVVSPELIVYHKWLIYSAAFKEPFAEQRGATHVQFYLDGTKTFAGKKTYSAGGCSRCWRFGMPGFLYAAIMQEACQ